MAKQSQQSNWLELFLEFMQHLTVSSKETGVGPLTLYGSQLRFLAEIIEGLERDVHVFVNLKAMQLGISTICLAIDLFWLAVHPGMHGVLLTDTQGNRDAFRAILRRFIGSLPKKYKIGVKKGGDNREHMLFTNESTLDFLIAGTRSTSTEVGRSRAYNFAHCTEVANYGALEGVVSLIDRLAEEHPTRLYIFESTAKGFNLFNDIWNKARKSPDTQKAFFIGWWAKDSYSLKTESTLFNKYWDGTIEPDEQEKVNNVYRKYGVRITPNQIAWYRWKMEQSSESSLMDQNFPWDEDDAFLQTGQGFFPVRQTVKLISKLNDNPPPFKGYAYEFHDAFKDTRLHKVRSADDAQLKIYEEPSEIGWYAMGVDPAYGRSENQDRSVIEVYRCYADRLVQVAEFASASPQSHQAAWVMAHLAGCYQNIMMIVEITGPGEATVLEIKHLREMYDAGMIPLSNKDKDITDLFGNARWFMYHRIDSPGAGYQFNWKSSSENKLSILGELRDSYTIGLIEVRSVNLAIEMQAMCQRGFVIEPQLTTQKDDRVFASAFAHRAWTQWIRPTMLASGDTWEKVSKEEAVRASSDHNNMVSHIVSEFFMGKDEERQERELEAMWH